MRKGKFLAIIVLLASIMVLLAYIVSRLDSPIATIFEPTSPTTTPTTTTATTVDEEALKRAKEEERRKLEQHIRDNTIYIAEGARIFKDTELSEEILIAEDKMSLYSLGLKDGFYEVKKDYYDTEVLGYISESFVHLSPMDFIELPEEDCEYEHVRSIPNFQENPRIKVRGVYVTIPTFLGSEYKNIVELINSTDLNAIVVDIKDDSEQLLFTSDSASEYNPAANKLANADKKDIEPLIKLAKDKGIYLIARIVTFKSPIYSKENREGIITYAGTNTPFTEDGILLWTSPMDKNLWEYNIGLAEEAIDLGFNEIQFDYVRFPTVPLSQEFFYKDLGNHSKTYAIQSFLKYAHERVNAKKSLSGSRYFWLGRNRAGRCRHRSPLGGTHQCRRLYVPDGLSKPLRPGKFWNTGARPRTLPNNRFCNKGLYIEKQQCLGTGNTSTMDSVFYGKLPWNIRSRLYCIRTRGSSGTDTSARG